MPLLIPRDPGPDAMTLWSSYARADNCNFWNPFSPDRSSYECSAFLLRPTGINLTNAWAYGMFCNFFLTAIPVVVFQAHAVGDLRHPVSVGHRPLVFP